jgi:hypothetical protein
MHLPARGRRLAPHVRRLHLEPLEHRRLLANVTVSNVLDVVNGNVASLAGLLSSDGGDGISLREAILAANADNTDAAATNPASETTTQGIRPDEPTPRRTPSSPDATMTNGLSSCHSRMSPFPSPS